ncbi:MAG: DUF4406 domain-containing protein [Bdellovibrionaceae bacterium]|nr:DUF4406 domain-containing protein [Pseudobdellovibrionaceae bacterium]
MNQQCMWIMVAGPFGHGTKSEEEKRVNLQKLNQAAVDVFRKGHIPIIGVNMALPMIKVVGQESYSEIMMPLSLSLCDRCDAILRIEGASIGADKELAKFQKQGKIIYRNISEIPNALK